MMIIGCDYHPGFQQIALVDTETGELQERRLEHREEAEKFYRELAVRGTSVRLGMEASGHAIFNESEMARSSECTNSYVQKVLDAADIVREAILQQLTLWHIGASSGWARIVTRAPF
jgi:hypothetical protein